MIRIIVIDAVLFLLPFAVYGGLLLIGHRTIEQEAASGWPLGLLTLIGLVLAAIGLFVLAGGNIGGEDGRYVPGHSEGGRWVPGHVEPGGGAR